MAKVAVCLVMFVASFVAGLREEPGLNLGIPMRSEEGRRLQAAGLQEVAASYGATLDAVHSHRLEEDSMVQVRHAVEPPPVAAPGRRLAVHSERDLVRMLMHMNAASYTNKLPYPRDVMEPIAKAGDSLYGEHVRTYEQEVEEEYAHQKSWAREFDGTYSTATGGLPIHASGLDSTGVHALEFTVQGIGKVLLFRGSTSRGDYDNILLWTIDWVLSMMTGKMKHDWVNLAKLPWSKDMQKNVKPLHRALSKKVLFTGAKLRVDKFFKELDRLANMTNGAIDPEKVALTGYWEFAKYIADSVRNKLQDDEELIITGHSQGGTRAQLVSMYFEKAYGKKYKTVTFGALGGQCFSRKLPFTGAALTDDVDPYVSHSQIVNYVHPLDIYGNYEYGFGTRCLYGATDVAESKARKYCEKVFGHAGYDITVAGQIMGMGKDLGNAFKRCRYFTHMWMAMDRDLMNDNYLFEDGATDGGCAVEGAIPKDDPEKKCTKSGAGSVVGALRRSVRRVASARPRSSKRGRKGTSTASDEYENHEGPAAPPRDDGLQAGERALPGATTGAGTY